VIGDTATATELRALYRSMSDADLERLRHALIQDGYDTDDLDTVDFVGRRLVIIAGVQAERDRCATCGASRTSPLTMRRVPGYPWCATCGAVTSVFRG
jgi:hypothetical protein